MCMHVGRLLTGQLHPITKFAPATISQCAVHSAPLPGKGYNQTQEVQIIV